VCFQALQADIDSHSIPISSVLNLSESLIADNAACPTEADKETIQKAVRELDELWPAIKSRSVERREL
jgi:hypothetical protein